MEAIRKIHGFDAGALDTGVKTCIGSKPVRKHISEQITEFGKRSSYILVFGISYFVVYILELSNN